MTYKYPYKLYIVFLGIFSSFSLYGYSLIHNSTKNFLIMRVIYILFCLVIMQWYYEKYEYYKGRFLTIDHKGISIYSENVEITLSPDDIDCIIVANHKHLLKIYNVIHIFTKNNDHYYLTNEINKYRKLKSNFKNDFENNYYELKKIVPSNFTVNKKELLQL